MHQELCQGLLIGQVDPEILNDKVPLGLPPKFHASRDWYPGEQHKNIQKLFVLLVMFTHPPTDEKVLGFAMFCPIPTPISTVSVLRPTCPPKTPILDPEQGWPIQAPKAHSRRAASWTPHVTGKCLGRTAKAAGISAGHRWSRRYPQGSRFPRRCFLVNPLNFGGLPSVERC